MGNDWWRDATVSDSSLAGWITNWNSSNCSVLTSVTNGTGTSVTVTSTSVTLSLISSSFLRFDYHHHHRSLEMDKFPKNHFSASGKRADRRLCISETHSLFLFPLPFTFTVCQHTHRIASISISDDEEEMSRRVIFTLQCLSSSAWIPQQYSATRESSSKLITENCKTWFAVA